MARNTVTALEVRLRDVTLPGDLALPADATGLVLFAHGSGSSRLSPRNRLVASMLNANRIGTLLFDLLLPDEDIGVERRFDIELLSDRLADATTAAAALEWAQGLRVGYFGASTGAAAAIRAAVTVQRTVPIAAIVSRGGRVDLAGAAALRQLSAPTLMIVGESDPAVVALNVQAAAAMHCEKALEIVPGATHLFEEPGALERVGDLAAGWFARYLDARSRS